MTNIIILPEVEQRTMPAKKPIEFTHYLGTDRVLREDREDSTPPSEYKNIELICLNYTNVIGSEPNYLKYDLMFAWNKKRSDGLLRLGHFNDGVVA
jgi:hypothetical protein